jgi:hypothetical protein
MPFVHLTDDGQSVTLDLHGARVDEAVDLAIRLVQVATRRGRTSLRLIHGASSSSDRVRNRTIKHALQDALDRGLFGSALSSSWQADAFLLLGLDATAAPDPKRITLLEVVD